MEAKIASQLTAANVPFEFEVDKFVYFKRVTSGECHKCGTLDVVQKHRYTPDFKVGPSWYIETKGIFGATDRRKMKLMQEQHPKIVIYLLFERNNVVSKIKGTRYSDWAKANGFTYAFKEVPTDWIERIKARE